MKINHQTVLVEFTERCKMTLIWLKLTPFHIILLFIVCSVFACQDKNASPTPKEALETTVRHREIYTPSGDWGGYIDYTYDKAGNLSRFSYSFTTFGGYDKSLDDFLLTNCVREYNVSQEGKLALISKITTDAKTGEPAQREFYEPEIEHWWTIAKADQAIKMNSNSQ